MSGVRGGQPLAVVVAEVRAGVLARLAAAVDDRERASASVVLAGLDRLADPFDERLGPVHVTGSAIVVGERGVLLLRHRRLGIWVQPGGHVDPGEVPWEAAVREAREETGLPVEHAGGEAHLVHVDVHPGGRGHTHLDLRYLLEGPAAEPVPPPGESQEIGWFAWDEAIARADTGLVGALRALRWALPRRGDGWEASRCERDAGER